MSKIFAKWFPATHPGHTRLIAGTLQSIKTALHHIKILALAVFMAGAPASCTMISKEMLPGLEYRENPQVEIIEYDDHARLQQDCAKQNQDSDWRYYGWRYSGCSLIPHDPDGTCIIRVMAGDERTKKHEIAHCHGYADTFLPWKADFNFYNRPGQPE